MRPLTTSVCGLKLLLYEVFRYRVCGLELFPGIPYLNVSRRILHLPDSLTRRILHLSLYLTHTTPLSLPDAYYSSLST
jgi:hypothetical protein